MVLGLAGAVAAAVPAASRWEHQTSGVTARLRGVSAVSAKVAWASGSAGTVLRTANAGPTCTKTGAGGQWTLQFTNEDPRAFFDAMAFWDASRGLVMGDSIDGRFDILITRDGGKSWNRIAAEKLPGALPNEGAFAGSGTNVAVFGRDLAWIGTGAAARSRVLRTKDGGATWAIAETPVAASPSAGIFSVVFRDPRRGMAAGGDYRKEKDAIDNAAATSDGGGTWTAVKGLGGFRSVVAYVPGSKASWVAVGPSGADLSDDDGRTWRPIEGPGYHAFSFARDGKTGWGVGERGSIGKLVVGSR
jgi:photosystem II stability/assembly factor-like uncharacterized protein